MHIFQYYGDITLFTHTSVPCEWFAKLTLYLIRKFFHCILHLFVPPPHILSLILWNLSFYFVFYSFVFLFFFACHLRTCLFHLNFTFFLITFIQKIIGQISFFFCGNFLIWAMPRSNGDFGRSFWGLISCAAAV